jgi:hypothetical protein
LLLHLFIEIDNGVKALPPLPSWPLVHLNGIVASLLSLLTSIQKAMMMMIQQSAVRGRAGEETLEDVTHHQVVLLPSDFG